MSAKCFFPFLIILGFLTSCLPVQPMPPSPPWVYADLRVLGSGDIRPASHDLVALYARSLQDELQIRLDLLDFAPTLDFDLYLALDTSPGGTQRLPLQPQADLSWDILITIPAGGRLLASDAGGKPIANLGLRVERDPFLDTIVVSMDQPALHTSQVGLKVEAFLTPAGSGQIASRLGPVNISASPPPPAHALLAFWNTFQAVTPALTLRRWNGAHTGPTGERHGLRSVLAAANETSSSLVLLDLKTLPSLSAVDYAGGLPLIRSMVQRGLLELPDVLPISAGPSSAPFTPPPAALTYSVNESRQAAQDFRLPASQILYTPRFPSGLAISSPSDLQKYKLVFTTDPKSSPQVPYLVANLNCQRWQNLHVVTLAASVSQSLSSGVDTSLLPIQQVSSSGPTIELRQALLENALQAARAGSNFAPCTGTPLILLGGDLSQSLWGNPEAARNTLIYLKAHPWIQEVHASDLLITNLTRPFTPPLEPTQTQTYRPTESNGNALLSVLTAEQIQDQLIAALQKSPPGPVTQMAWQAYESLSAPAQPALPPLYLLRANYLGQVGELLAAARWASEGADPICQDTPIPSGPCAVLADLDWDGENEVILASQHFFAVFERQGGYLTFAFTRNASGVHQFIAPSSQFITGNSDPMTWNAGVGMAGDSGSLRGAFSDVKAGFLSPSWDLDQVSLAAGKTEDQVVAQAIFISPDRQVNKTIQLSDQGLHADYQTSVSIDVKIPIGLDPWRRFSPDWADQYQIQSSPQGWTWALGTDLAVEVTTSANLNASSFKDTRSIIRQPENPNDTYPSGHYLPFPLALLEISGEGSFSIDIKVK